MASLCLTTQNFSNLLINSKVATLETALQQCLLNFQELMNEVRQLEIQSESYKIEWITQKDKCESKSCNSSELYKKVVESKDTIIQTAASAIIRLDETKNLKIVSEVLKTLCGESANTLSNNSEETSKTGNKVTINTPLSKKTSKKTLSTPKKNKISPVTPTKKKKLFTPKKELKENDFSPKKEPDSSIENVSIQDASVSEIDGTPGRTSPIIHTKKLKSSSSSSSLGTNSPARDKKKCPDSWNSPEPKQMKLCYTLGRSGQTRMTWYGAKPSSVVDLTCSPEHAGGTRDKQNPSIQKLLIKQESSENEETIQPSPTSTPANIILSNTNKPSVKDNPKSKKPPLSLSKVKKEMADEACSPIIQVVEKKTKDLKADKSDDAMEESINILQPNRFRKTPPKPAVSLPAPAQPQPPDADVTHCEDASMSILHHVNKMEDRRVDDEVISPSKRPLFENKNLMNLIPEQVDAISSIQPEVTGKTPALDNGKRKPLENQQPLYKEPTVRKKAEKLALPAWCCDECQRFFGNLYANDPEKIRGVIERCSKHRGRNNPVRPKTPPGIWNPRWDVPADTEEFNRRNHAV